MPNVTKPKTSKGEAIDALLNAFEDAKHVDNDGVEFWLARELAPLLGYKRWENFETAIGRAQVACQNVGEDMQDHFRGATKMVEIGSGAKREQQDYELTRFAAYLIALNGDPNKHEIAAAQTYFAVQTRRQEMADMAEGLRPALMRTNAAFSFAKRSRNTINLSPARRRRTACRRASNMRSSK